MNTAETAVAAAIASGPVAGIEALARVADPSEAAEATHAAMRSAYWDHKDVPLLAALAYSGIGRALADAEQMPDQAVRLRSAAKAMAYDLASFTWPGWDEPGITVGPIEAAAGLAAARINLIWARALDKGPLAESRAQWMLGAHLMGAEEYADALTSFRSAAALAREVPAHSEECLAEAFADLARMLAGEHGADRDLATVLERLRTVEDGEAFAAQVESARGVFA